MRINENTVIKCNNLEEVKDCLNKLEELGFKKYYRPFESAVLISFPKNKAEDRFYNFSEVIYGVNNSVIKYKFFLKLYNKQIKKKKNPIY